MILRISYDGDREPTDVTTNPTESDVANAVRSMDWNRFAFVTLVKDDDNWLDGSGCLEPDCGLSMMLSIDRIQYVAEAAPPTPDSMLETFSAYLDGDDDLLFALIYDARRRGLTAEDITTLRREEETTQRERMMREAVAEAAELFSNEDYGAFIQKLGPFESLLGAMDAKKLSIARKRHSENTSNA
jgi:hypothetical protein